ncbi:hypothetical protein P5V15_012671 [Pogonomyrmex californicus]
MLFVTESQSEEKQLFIAIWFMAMPDSYRSVVTKFGVERDTAFRALRRVTYALHYQVALDVMERFQQLYGFPNVIGAIDEIHIKIQALTEDENT